MQSRFVSRSCFHCCGRSARISGEEHYHRMVDSQSRPKEEGCCTQTWAKTIHFCGNISRSATEISTQVLFLWYLVRVSSRNFTRGCCTPPSTAMHNYSFTTMAHRDGLGGTENLMKSIEQELNHVFHTIGSENGAWDTGDSSGGFQSAGWNWKWTAAPSPLWQPRVNKSQFPSIALHRWPQKDFFSLYSQTVKIAILRREKGVYVHLHPVSV